MVLMFASKPKVMHPVQLSENSHISICQGRPASVYLYRLGRVESLSVGIQQLVSDDDIPS
jgi:hypothetical protein